MKAPAKPGSHHPGNMPPLKSLADLKGGTGVLSVYEKPTPKVARRKPGKVLTAAEKAAFLASRPDLNSKG